MPEKQAPMMLTSLLEAIAEKVMWVKQEGMRSAVTEPALALRVPDRVEQLVEKKHFAGKMPWLHQLLLWLWLLRSLMLHLQQLPAAVLSVPEKLLLLLLLLQQLLSKTE